MQVGNLVIKLNRKVFKIQNRVFSYENHKAFFVGNVGKSRVRRLNKPFKFYN